MTMVEDEDTRIISIVKVVQKRRVVSSQHVVESVGVWRAAAAVG